MSATPSRRMATRRVGSLLLLFEGPEAPADAEWDECLALLRPIVSEAKVLVMTRGGGPTPAQRKRLSEVIGKYPLRVAVATDSVKVYFIASSVALFIPRIRSFRLTEIEDAFAHLGLTPNEADVARKALGEMRTEVKETAG